MNLRLQTASPSWRVASWDEDGAAASSRPARRIASVRRERGRYVAVTPRGRTVGAFDSRAEAAHAVGLDHRAIDPARAWTALLATVNVAMLGSLAVLASALLR